MAIGTGWVACPFSLSVCQSVVNDGEFWKNGWLDWDAIWSSGSGEPKKCIRFGCTALFVSGKFGQGKWGSTMQCIGRMQHCGLDVAYQRVIGLVCSDKSILCHDGWQRGLFSNYFETEQSSCTVDLAPTDSRVYDWEIVVFCQMVSKLAFRWGMSTSCKGSQTI